MREFHPALRDFPLPHADVDDVCKYYTLKEFWGIKGFKICLKFH